MDQTLLTFFNQTLAHPLLDWLMIAASTAGLALLPVLGLALLLSPKQRRVGQAILAGMLVGLILALIFQQLAGRPRPEAVRLLLPVSGFPSFPSGHATLAFSTAMVLLLAYRRRTWSILALTGATLIALSRLYLGMHYPADLIGGAILGSASGAVAYGLIVARRAGSFNWGWLLWLQIAVALLVTQMAYLGILPYRLLDWPLADKVLHFLLIGSIAFWLNLWLDGRTLSGGYANIPLAIVIPFSLALAEEGLQSFSPLRTASLIDLSSDLLGLLLFWWLSRKLIAWQNEPYASPASRTSQSPGH